jgi:death-on-curing protein
VIFLTLDDICEINRDWVQRYGGRYIDVDKNLHNRASLEYILAAIQYPVFGYDRFPTLIDKASALAWWIVEGHVFNDGNKRTGMQSAIELLELNGAMTHFNVDIVVEIPLAVANGSISLPELTNLMSTYVELQ